MSYAVYTISAVHQFRNYYEFEPPDETYLLLLGS